MTIAKAPGNGGVVVKPYFSISRRLLSLVTAIDVSFRRQNDVKSGRGSGFLLRLDSAAHPRICPLIRKLQLLSPDTPEPAGGISLPILVTCRHVVDRAYNHAGEYGWNLSEVRAQMFGEDGERLTPAVFPHGDFSVLVPKNDRLDIALLAIGIVHARGLVGTRASMKKTNATLHAMDVRNITEDSHMCGSLPWGAEIAFTSIQPWTNGYPILRSGRVSSDPKVGFHSPDIDKDDIYLLEAQSFAGSSGAPIMTYPTGHPFFDHLTMKRAGGERQVTERHRRSHLVGIMSGHIRNNRHESGELYKLHVGLSYCHRIDVLRRILFEEPLERIWPK